VPRPEFVEIVVEGTLARKRSLSNSYADTLLTDGHICTRKVAASPSVPHQLFSRDRIKQVLSGCEVESDWLISTSKRASHKGLPSPPSLLKIFSDLES
jgi:hypothetical protein